VVIMKLIVQLCLILEQVIDKLFGPNKINNGYKLPDSLRQGQLEGYPKEYIFQVKNDMRIIFHHTRGVNIIIRRVNQPLHHSPAGLNKGCINLNPILSLGFYPEPEPVIVEGVG